MPKQLSHYDRVGRARMVDISGKSATKREAEASAFVAMGPAVLAALPNNPKGDTLEVARLAGIMAAKRTAELIPLCHPLPLSFVDVDLRLAHIVTGQRRGANRERTGAVERAQLVCVPQVERRIGP